MFLTKTQLHELGQYLWGSCKTVDEGLEDCFGCSVDDLENEMEVYEFLEDDNFWCTSCGWWFERIDQSENEYENTCKDCG